MTRRSESLPDPTLFDPFYSHAVLIGASSFQHLVHLSDLPAVARNLQELQRLLTDPAIGGLTEDRCTVIGQDELNGPGGKQRALDAIHNAALATCGTLLVYYAGHGLLDRHAPGALLLALPGSDENKSYTSLDYAEVRTQLQLAKRAHHTVVILDCCFAGRAAAGNMGPGQEHSSLSALAQIPGTCIVAAAAPNAIALSPPDELYTAFTGELIRVLADGSDQAGAYWDLATLYQHLFEALKRKERPLPEILDHNLGSGVRLARNLAHRAGPKLPPGLTDLFQAQVRAADSYLYRLVGTRRAMIEVYVRQDMRAVNGPKKDQSGGESNQNPAVTEQHPISRVAGLPRRIHDILDERRNFVVIGGPGLGKSTQTVQLAAELARTWLSDDGDWTNVRSTRLIPLRVVASVLAAENKPLETALIRAARAALGQAADIQLPQGLLGLAPDRCEWLVIVDGLDEIADVRARQRLIGILSSRAKEPTGRFRFLLTTRPLPPRELAGFGSSDSRYQLQAFDQGRLAEFAERWFEDSDATAAGFLQQLRSASLGELVQVPLLATIAAIAYESHPDQPLPSNRYGLYEEYLRYLVTERAEETARQWHKLQDRLAAFSPEETSAARSLFQRRMDLTHHLAELTVAGENDLVSAALKWVGEATGVRVPHVMEWRELVTAALNSTGLFTFESGELSFIHASFGDHLAAAAQARRLPTPYSSAHDWDQVITAAAGPFGDQSRAVLTHYAYQYPEDGALLQYLQRNYVDLPTYRLRRLLAGRLLAEGVPATASHYRSFLNSLENVINGGRYAPSASPGDYKDWFAVAGRMADTSVIDVLRATAADDDKQHHLRTAAAVALRETDPELAVSTLRELLTEEDAETLQEAGIALIGCGSNYTTEVLRAFLADGDRDLRLTAHAVLAGLRPQQIPAAIDVLRTLLVDGDPDVRRGVGIALAVVDPATAAEFIQALIINETAFQDAVDEILERLPAEYLPDVADALAELHRHSSPRARRGAAVVRCGLGHGFATAPLQLLLLDADPDVSSGAAEVLHHASPELLSDDLLAVTRLFPVQPRLVESLMELGEQCVSDVCRLLAKEPRNDPHRSLHVVAALRHFGPRFDEVAANILTAIIDDVEPAVRARATITMLELGPDHLAKAVDYLAEQIDDLDSSQLQEAAATLVRHDPSTVGTLLHVLRSSWDSGDFAVFIAAMQTADGEAVADFTQEMLTSFDGVPTVDAAEVLFDMGVDIPLRNLIDSDSDSMEVEVEVREIREKLGPLRADELDVAVQILRRHLADLPESVGPSILRRVSDLGPSYANVVTLAFPARGKSL